MVSSPAVEVIGVSPVLRSRKHPVPYVFFASPGATAPWPKSAACWSPAIPATGMPAGSPSWATVSPNTPAEGPTRGNTSRGMPRWPSSSASHSSRRMSKQSVRDAFDGSVAWTRPPVSCQRSHVSTVPKASSPRAARSERSGRLASSQAILVPEK